jgi:hypothetical protein
VALVYEHELAGRLVQISLPTTRFALLRAAPSHPELRECDSQFMSHVGRLIRRALIHDQHLESFAQIGQYLQNMLQIFRQGPFRVKHRKDHT